MALGQVLAFSLTPVLSRVYSPSDFGAFVVFSSIFSFLNIGLMARYEQAVLYAKSGSEAAALVTTSVALLLGLSVLSILILNACPIPIAPTIERALFVLALVTSASLSVSQRLISLLLVRWKRIRAVSLLNFARPLVVPLAQLSAIVACTGVIGLIVGHVFAYLALLVFSVALAPKLRLFVMPLAISDIKKVTVHHSGFPLYNLPQNLLFVGIDAIFAILVVRIFGAEAGGLFWFASKVAMAPVLVLVESVRPIVYRQIATSHNAGKFIAPAILRSSVRLGVPIAVASLAMSIAGNSMFGFIFGVRWAHSGQICAALLLLATAHAMTVPVIAALPVLQKQRLHLVVEIFASVFRVGVLVAFQGQGLLLGVLLSVGMTFLIYSSFAFYVYALAVREDAARRNVITDH